MESAGIPSTRWFDATLLPKDQVSQPDTLQAMFVMGHGVNTITSMPEAVRGMEKLDLLVVCDPYPTAWSVLSERKNGTYLLPACTSFEMDGSRTASNRSLQWGEQIVKPIFEAKNDYDVMYMLAKKLGFADKMFKNIKVENGAVSAEDILREINRGGWSTGYCGQSPERLKAHMKNQAKFDLVTLSAPKDDPEVGGDYYGLPWPCWGTPEFRHPGTAILYNTNLPVKEGGGTFRARFGVERVTASACSPTAPSFTLGSEIKDGYPEFTLGVLKKLGWDKDLTAPEMEIIERVNAANPDAVSWSLDLSGGIQRVAIEHGCSPYGNGKARMIAWNLPDPIPVHREVDLHAAARSRRQISDAAGRPAISRPEHRLHRPEVRCRQGHCQAIPAYPEFRPAGRIRRRRRGDALQQVARRIEAGHVRRDQSGGCSRARHQGRRLGLGHRRREQFQDTGEGVCDRACRQGRRLDALPLCRLVRRRRSAQQISEGRDPIVLGESVNTLTTYGYDPATGMQEPKATLCQIRAA